MRTRDARTFIFESPKLHLVLIDGVAWERVDDMGPEGHSKGWAQVEVVS